MQDIWKADFEWSILFEAFPYTKKYRKFVRILLAAPDDDQLRDWVGWVKSRFRSLLLKVKFPAFQFNCISVSLVGGSSRL